MTTKPKPTDTTKANVVQQPEIKKKSCFVVMPISDMNGYENGHFARVYEYIIKPALERNNYVVERADDTFKSDYIVVGIVQKIITSDLVICDLSGRNPNVMYELGIRHAFDKPVVLIKDKITEKVFDIQGLRYSEYDQSLRIDTVHKDIEKISLSIQETYDDKEKSINSIVALASVQAATIPDNTVISAEAQLILSALNSIGSKLNYKQTSDKDDQINGFYFNGNKVVFNDGSEGDIGSEVYDEHHNLFGVITRIDLKHDGVYLHLRRNDGQILVVSSRSKTAWKLTEMPF